MSSIRLEGSPKRERRSGTFSLSSAFRSSPKRASVIDQPMLPELSLADLQPTCLEKIHYPVFNPKNPQHNPSAALTRQLSPPGCRQDHQTLPPDSPRQGSWLEEFPRRSIHKARSGLLAIRASLLRLSSREGSDLSECAIDGILEEATTPEPRRIRRPGFSSTTQEDLSFGIGLYRTAASPWVADLEDVEFNPEDRAESPLSMMNVNSAPAGLESHISINVDPEPVIPRPRSLLSEDPPPYQFIEDTTRHKPRYGHFMAGANDNEELDADKTNDTNSDLARSETSMDLNDLGSPASSFKYEDMIPPQKAPASPSLSPRESTRGTMMKQLETMTPQDFLPLLPKMNTCRSESLVPLPNPSSEIVTIAFPGVYQALLDQWSTEARNKAADFPFASSCSSAKQSQALKFGDGAGPELLESGKRHSFGLHMSLRNEQEPSERPYAGFGSSQIVFTAQPCPPPTPTASQNSSQPSDSTWNQTVESLYDGSEYSSYGYHGSSTNYTSPTSISNDIWSPLESPIDDELLFSPFPRNEYYQVDGKSSGFYPSPDNQPVKSERRFYGDGSIHSGWGLDRTRSDRLREIAEPIPTMGSSRFRQPDLRTGRGESDSTDDSSVIRNIIDESSRPS